MNTLRKTAGLLIALPFIFWAMGCKKDEPTLGDPPTSADAAFTYQESADSPNILEFTATNSTVTAKWDFGNGTTAEGTTVTGSFPNAGTYTVVLTVFNSGGSASSSQDIVIENDDATLLNNPIYTILTGGVAGSGSKTWVIDSTRQAHFGVGPNPIGSAGNWPEYYNAGPLEKTASGLYSDRYVFKLSGFKFDQLTNGSVYVDNLQEANFPGAVEAAGDLKAPYADQLDETWTIVEGADTTITLSGGSFLGFYTGVNTYKVVRMNENELFLQYEDTEDAALLWYIRLVPVDYPVAEPSNDPKFSLPLDFETVEPIFEVFGGNSYQFIANPDMTGINTSAKVLEVTHGGETWGGLFVNLENPLNFSSDTTIAVKIWSATTDTFRIKLENSANTAEFVEKDDVVTVANQWTEVSVSFSGAANIYDRLVLFPGWGTTSGTFYLDDAVQR